MGNSVPARELLVLQLDQHDFSCQLLEPRPLRLRGSSYEPLTPCLCHTSLPAPLKNFGAYIVMTLQESVPSTISAMRAMRPFTDIVEWVRPPGSAYRRPLSSTGPKQQLQE